MHNLLGWSLLLFCLVLGGGCSPEKKKVKEVAVPPVESPPPPLSGPILTPEQEEIKQLLARNGGPRLGSSPTVLVVRKRDRRLVVYKGLTPIRSYPVVLGADPNNDKLRQGDRCTPEGVYRVVAKFDHPRWDKFILLDYPNTQNWLKFNRAKRDGLIPHNAEIGGEIGIHGTDDPLKNIQGVNWTLGCVSLLNEHIEQIYPLVDKNTLVYIKRQ